MCDAETGEYEFVSPGEISSLDELADPQTELDDAYGRIQAEHEAMLDSAGGEGPGSEQAEAAGTVSHEDGDGSERPGAEQLRQYARGAFDAATQGGGGLTLPEEQVQEMLQRNRQLYEQEQRRKAEEASRQPTALERIPVDEQTGEPVFERADREMADGYDGRALQSPVIVSKDGIVLSGNNRTMSGDLAAEHGTDKAYTDHLREYGDMYGFSAEQVDGMKHPRVVFVPDERLPYDAKTFARFNAESQKKQGKPEQAVKLGKVVPDRVFESIAGDIAHYDRLSDYYSDEKAVAGAINLLRDAGVINDVQLPELRTGGSLSAAGRELIENTLIGKVFQTSPDAVRQVIGNGTLRQSVVTGLNEIAHNRMLAGSGYDLCDELSAAIDLVSRAKAEDSEAYKEGRPVSPFGRRDCLTTRTVTAA